MHRFNPGPSKLFCALLLLVCSCTTLAYESPQSQLVNVGEHRLNFNLARGTTGLNLVFEPGAGDDSSAWDEVAPGITRDTGATVVTYDRAGFGDSEPATGPYQIDAEVTDLKRGLDELGIKNNIVLIAHSYGGFVATLFATKFPATVRGVVLIDANLVSSFTDPIVQQLMEGIASQREAMQLQQPAMLRLLDALPQTVQRLREVTFPTSIPVLVIAAENPPASSPDGIALWKRVHQEFVAGADNRRLVEARGAGHFVMGDAPQVVIDSVRAFTAELTKKPNGKR